MSSRRALVIGGSLGGLLAAHLLRHVGWDVTVFERNTEDLTGRGAGLSTHPQLIEVLPEGHCGFLKQIVVGSGGHGGRWGRVGAGFDFQWPPTSLFVGSAAS